MMIEFKTAEWNERPPAVQPVKGGMVRVARKVESFEREGATLYKGECAIMSEAAYAAYVGAMEVTERREAEIIDDYTMSLIEGGVI